MVWDSGQSLSARQFLVRWDGAPQNRKYPHHSGQLPGSSRLYPTPLLKPCFSSFSLHCNQLLKKSVTWGSITAHWTFGQILLRSLRNQSNISHSRLLKQGNRGYIKIFLKCKLGLSFWSDVIWAYCFYTIR